MRHIVLLLSFVIAFGIGWSQSCVDIRPKFYFDAPLDSLSVGDIRVIHVLYNICVRGGGNNFLDSIILVKKFLDKHPNITIEISFHTDTRGTQAANLKGMQIRASQVSGFLAENQVPENQFTCVGKGEDEPICPEEIINTMPTEQERENAHAINRRIDVKITSIK